MTQMRSASPRFASATQSLRLRSSSLRRPPLASRGLVVSPTFLVAMPRSGRDWIAVDQNIGDSGSMDDMASALGVRRAEAIGLWVSLLGKLRAAGSNGELAGRSNSWVERMAGWEGAVGMFAKYLHAHCVDDHGCIANWEAWQWPSGTDRTNAERQKRFRERHRAPKDDVTTPVTLDPVTTVQNSTVQEDSTEQQPTAKTKALVRRNGTSHDRMPALDLVLAREAEKTVKRERRVEHERAIVEHVFAYWATRTNHPQVVLDKKRGARIHARLIEQHGSARKLFFAVDGALRDPWLMGKDDHSTKKYDGVQTIFRDCEQVERLADLIPDFRQGLSHPQELHIQPLEDESDGGLSHIDGPANGEAVSVVVPHEPARLATGAKR